MNVGSKWKVNGIAKVITIYSKGNKKVCTKFHSNPSNRGQHFHKNNKCKLMVMLEKIVMGSVAMAESCRIAKNYSGCHTESVYYLDRPH